ncbi:unnamed protein product [[Candida] boidinii]|nr:unnamed protein product [[Candida] boidinii]
MRSFLFKTVHWSDELVDYVETEANVSSDSTNNAGGVSLNYANSKVNTIDENLQDISQGYSNIDNNNNEGNMLGKVLTKLGYNGGSGASTSKKSYSKIQDEENAIELDDQFIVESDDEFGSRDHHNDYSGNNASSSSSK